MRILFVSQWFDPEPFYKGLPFIHAIQALGHDVEVLTGFPNYPEGTLYPGYRMRLVQRETMAGVPVIRVPLYPSHDTSARGRILNYLSFAVSAGTLGPWITRPADVMHIYHPPATVAWPAKWLKCFRGLPFVYDIQDLWPDTLVSSGMFSNRAALALLDRWCRHTYRVADHIVVLSPGMKTTLLQRGVDAHKISVIYNWTEESEPLEPDPECARAWGFTGQFTILFAGNIGTLQALHTVLEAAALLLSHPARIQFILIGAGVEKPQLEERAVDMGLTNVRFVPRQPRATINQLFAVADALLVQLKDQPLFNITIPSKIQAYLAAGRPILAAVRGDAADLITQAGAGVCCAPEDPRALADAALRLAACSAREREVMGQQGRDYYTRHLSLSAGAQQFVQLYSQLLTARGIAHHRNTMSGDT